MTHLSNLLKYSEQKLEKLKQIKGATIEQKKAIDDNDIDTLNSLIEKKQVAIDFINKCDDAFQKELESVKRKLGVKSFQDITETDGGAEKKALVEIVHSIIKTINDTKALEKDNHRRLLDAMDEAKQKLKKVRKGQKSVAMYDKGMGGMGSGSFIDKKK